MAKKYKFLRVDMETMKNIELKQLKMNAELAKMGVKEKIKKVTLAKYWAKKPIHLDNIELIKLAKKKRL